MKKVENHFFSDTTIELETWELPCSIWHPIPELPSTSRAPPPKKLPLVHVKEAPSSLLGTRGLLSPSLRESSKLTLRLLKALLAIWPAQTWNTPCLNSMEFRTQQSRDLPISPPSFLSSSPPHRHHIATKWLHVPLTVAYHLPDSAVPRAWMAWTQC